MTAAPRPQPQNPTHTYTTAGTYTVSLTATNAYGSDTATRTNYITVNNPPVGDFSLQVTPSSQTIRRGGSVTYSVTIQASGGFSAPVTLSISGEPSKSTVTFSPNPATGTSTLTIATSRGDSWRTYDLTITGVSGILSHSTSASLTVSK